MYHKFGLTLALCEGSEILRCSAAWTKLLYVKSSHGVETFLHVVLMALIQKYRHLILHVYASFPLTATKQIVSLNVLTGFSVLQYKSVIEQLWQTILSDEERFLQHVVVYRTN